MAKFHTGGSLHARPSAALLKEDSMASEPWGGGALKEIEAASSFPALLLKWAQRLDHASFNNQPQPHRCDFILFFLDCRSELLSEQS